MTMTSSAIALLAGILLLADGGTIVSRWKGFAKLARFVFLWHCQHSVVKLTFLIFSIFDP